jgi:hypothetical protein
MHGITSAVTYGCVDFDKDTVLFKIFANPFETSYGEDEPTSWLELMV